MTCCIAALAKKRGAVVLVADRLIGPSAIGGEPDEVLTFEPIHKDWWVMFAGDVALSVSVIDRLKRAFLRGPLSADDAGAHLTASLEAEWVAQTETLFLRPRAWSTATFRDEAPSKLAPEMHRELTNKRLAYDLDLALIVAGFDKDGIGHVMRCHGSGEKRFLVDHHDTPGYTAIGTRAETALDMMSYKNVRRSMGIRTVAYYAIEGKFFSESGRGVGERPGMMILRHNREAVFVNTDALEKCIEPICRRLAPKNLRKRDRKKLNRIEALKNFSNA